MYIRVSRHSISIWCTEVSASQRKGARVSSSPHSQFFEKILKSLQNIFFFLPVSPFFAIDLLYGLAAVFSGTRNAPRPRKISSAGHLRRYAVHTVRMRSAIAYFGETNIPSLTRVIFFFFFFRHYIIVLYYNLYNVYNIVIIYDYYIKLPVYRCYSQYLKPYSNVILYDTSRWFDNDIIAISKRSVSLYIMYCYSV